MRYYVEIENHDGLYRARVFRDGATHRPEKDVQLARAAEVTTKGYVRTLGEVADAFVNFQLADFDERTQLDVGQYLYTQIFGAQRPSDLRRDDTEHVEVRIITADEHVRRLPWALLAHEGDFLSACNWSVAFAPHHESDDCELPELPRLLLVMPQAEGWIPTLAEEHLAGIKEILAPVRARRANETLSIYHAPENLRVARDWAEFAAQVREFKPHIIYYYGHGKGNEYTSRLIFPGGVAATEIPLTDVRNLLQAQPSPPKLIYLNCCSGDTGGHLGAGGQLSALIPAVVANCTQANIDAAQAQGLIFLEKVILRGDAPHRAVAELRRDLTRPTLNLTTGDARWLTPVIYCSYNKWSYKPPLPDNVYGEVNRQIKLNRNRQFGFVLGQTSDMLQDGRPRALAFAWYGLEKQGVPNFHERLDVEINKRLRDMTFYSLPTKWPDQIFGTDPFANMLLERFGDIRDLSQLPGRIREASGSSGGEKILVYVSHTEIKSREFFGPPQLRSYLAWWDRQAKLLADPNIFYILGLPFIVSNPGAFDAAVSQQVMPVLDLRSSRFRLLDEMGYVTEMDIIDYFEVYHHEIGLAERRATAHRIWEFTQGHYEATVEELKMPQFYHPPAPESDAEYFY